jgi:peptidyl-prolyl cis-trans isomerase A (cyclophilin A)
MNFNRVQKITMHTLKHTALGLALCSSAWVANATTVQIQTVMGEIEINLYDKDTPKTVENFLDYVEAGVYTNSIIHRTVPQFIVQGGGFRYTGILPPSAIPANAAVVNEPIFSNVRGTIAMAKLDKKPNSATNQWFINLSDNSANLDAQNGGFTVFGQVTAGMDVVNAIAAVNRYDLRGSFGHTFGEIPLRDYAPGQTADDDHLVMVTGIEVLDPSPDTADDLNPVRAASSSSSSGGGDGGSSGGGSVSISLLGMLLMLGTLLVPGVRVQRRK